MKKTLLLLAGTAEARAFAERFDHPDLRLIASLAGLTREPRSYPCETRVGGFGGVEAMSEWIAENNVVAVLDATHPFATQISLNANEAARTCAVPCLGLRRTVWELGADWREFESVEALAAALPAGSRVLLTTGRHGIDAFAQRDDCAFWLRTIEAMGALPSCIQAIEGRPPFSLRDELAVMTAAGITHLVTKNAGGALPAKLEAAGQLGLPVFSVAMPPSPHAVTANSVEGALAWVGELFAGRGA